MSDVLIIGAGPAGSSTAIELSKAGLSVILAEKSTFPRDKTCGDAISVDVINQLEKLSPDLLSRFAALKEKTPSKGVRIVAPNGCGIDIPFVSDSVQKQGYVCRRKDFDKLLLDEARSGRGVSVMENCEVNDLRVENNGVVAESIQGSIRAQLVVGADGAHSIVKRKLASSRINPRYHSGGVRIYHQNVSGFNEGNFIELYFFRDILPGYVWVFPLPDGQANTGIGMLTSVISSRNANLVRTLRGKLSTHPLLAGRFSNAGPMESPRGHGLPLGGAEGRISGDRFLLTGDAASMIDPFSGEGISNAIRSGRFAARQIITSFAKKDFSSVGLSNYDRTLNSALRNEFRTSRSMLRLAQFPWILNTIANKAHRNAQLHQTLIDALAQPDQKRWLVSPSFYANLLFRS